MPAASSTRLQLRLAEMIAVPTAAACRLRTNATDDGKAYAPFSASASQEGVVLAVRQAPHRLAFGGSAAVPRGQRDAAGGQEAFDAGITRDAVDIAQVVVVRERFGIAAGEELVEHARPRRLVHASPCR